MNIPGIGEISWELIISWLKIGLSQLEGEYKWYAVALVMFIVTAAITQYIFKTLKWFLLLMLLGVLLFGAFWGLSYLSF